MIGCDAAGGSDAPFRSFYDDDRCDAPSPYVYVFLRILDIFDPRSHPIKPMRRYTVRAGWRGVLDCTFNIQQDLFYVVAPPKKKVLHHIVTIIIRIETKDYHQL